GCEAEFKIKGKPFPHSQEASLDSCPSKSLPPLGLGLFSWISKGTKSSKQQSPPRPVPSSLVSLQLYQTFPVCMLGSVRASQALPIKPLSVPNWCMKVESGSSHSLHK
uniref:Uncharacterized protein n=1 Tax=Prolemur simus TaxID=1328070 RepID=A0A8C9AD51_PROSS